MANTHTKKITAFMSVVAMLLSMMLYFPDGTFSIDFGLKANAAAITLTEPSTDGNGIYQIGTAAELYWFADKVNNDNDTYGSVNAVLTADIVVNENVLKTDGTPNGTSFTSWLPIGTDINFYAGSFDGQNHTISGLYFNDASTNFVGLFGANAGTIKNVGVVDSYFIGYNGVGGVCAGNIGVIENCYNTGTIGGTGNFVGGVCGITECQKDKNGTITNCYNTGTVSSSNYVGGVCGFNSAGTITNCYNTGTVSGSHSASGVCADNYGTITNCYNTGAVSGSDGVGGVCVDNYGTITNCYYDSDKYIGNAVENKDESAVADVEGKTTAQFKSGEVAYLLSQGENGEIWGQEIGVDTYPVLDGATVYQIAKIYCDNTAETGYTYLNYYSDILHNEYNSNGYCTNCGAYQPISFNKTANCYEISNAGQLYWFADKVNNDNADYGSTNVVLTADITVNTGVLQSDGTLAEDTSGFISWTPIGNTSSLYTGKFDGQGHTISGLYFNNTSTSYVGLFGCLGSGGEIKNVGVIDSYFRGYSYVSGICGENNSGTITGCYNNGTVSSSYNYVGGVCGVNHNEITGCYNTGIVSGRSRVGGVSGWNGDSGTIIGCYNIGAVSCSKSYAGGVCGYNYTTITGCYTNNSGVYGYKSGGSITDCEEYTDDEFINSTVCGLLNTALQNASVNVRFYQGTNNPELIINVPMIVEGLYQISDKQELYGFAQLVNIGVEPSANAVLTADITVNTGVLKSDGTLADDTSGFTSWTPIGNSSSPYTGIFDGQSHTISGLYVNNTSTSYVGLIGFLGSGGEITNAGVIDSYLRAYAYVSGICGENNSGTITGCYNTSTVSSSYNYAGGVCGVNRNAITGCYNTGTVSGRSRVGGVCGWSGDSGTMINCYNIGAISSSKGYVGGLCGYNYTTITGCYNTGTVSSSSYSGCVCGYNTSTGTIKNCFYDSDKYSGKPVGTTYGTITDVEGKTTAQFASGEVAYLLNGSTSEGTLAWGQTIGKDDTPVLDSTKKVYLGYITCIESEVMSYSNTELSATRPAHNYLNGLCTVCGVYEPGVFNETDNCYEISKTSQLYWFAQQVNGGNTGINVVLTANITVNTGVLKSDGTLANDTSGFKSWTPIGDASNQYSGTFDGQGFTVSGLYCNDSDVSDVGLFGGNCGTIKNVSVVDSYFKSNVCAGGVCGHNAASGTITNCYNAGTVSGSEYVGGVCGWSAGTITNCCNIADVRNVTYYAGGVCGIISYSSIITNCYNTGNISGALYAGGVCGANYSDVAITNCYYDSDKYSGNAVDAGTGTVADVEGKTSAQFASGEVAYLLSQGCTAGEITYDGSIWGQTIGIDNSPVLGGTKVYQVDAYAGCKANPGTASTGYSNIDAPVYAEHSMTEHSVNAATCKNPGNYAYWTCSYENGVYYKDEARTDTFANLEATVIPALEHEDTDNDGYCNNGCGQPVRSIVKEVSATLNGDIGLNYYMALPESVKADEGAYVQFNVNGQTTEVYLKDLTAEEDGTYKVTCWLTAKEMRDNVTFELYDGSGTNVDIYKNSGEKIEGASFDYSLETYFDALSSDENAALKNLADATLIYGAYAQNAFNHNADPTLDGSELSDVIAENLESFKMTKSADIPEDLKLTEMTLILETETTLRLYFKSEYIDNYTFKLDGSDVTLNTIAEEDLYYVEIANISAKDLDTMHTLEINGDCTLTFNALSYAYAVLKTSNNDDLCNVVKALCKYNEAANAYFGD